MDDDAMSLAKARREQELTDKIKDSGTRREFKTGAVRDMGGKKMADVESLYATINDLKASVAYLEKQLAEKIEENKPTPPHPRWKPKRDEPYYTINMGCACAGLNTWDSDNFDENTYSLGFVFKSEAEARFAAERLKVLAEMREWAGKWNDTYAITYITVPGGDTRIMVNDRLSTLSHGGMRFATIDDAENCIKAVGEERLKKYYFMIEG